MTRILAVASVLFVSCQPLASTGVKTAELYARLELEAPGDGRVLARAKFTKGVASLTSLELQPGETVVGSWNGTSRAMRHERTVTETFYEAAFDGDAAGTELKISLNRTEDVSAPDSVVTLPPPLVLTAPVAGQAYPRSEGVTVTYAETSMDPLRFSAKGACIEGVEKLLTSDTGAYTLPAFTASRGNEAASCDVELRVSRSRKGRVDPAYGEGGDFTATVTRAVIIRSIP